jgi:hypothetical protein
MAVSIMLTSCGKSSGLSNRNKGADNKTLSAGTFANEQSQEKKDNDHIKLSWIIDYASDRKLAIGSITIVVIAAIVLGSFFAIKKGNPFKAVMNYFRKNKQPQIKPPPKWAGTFSEKSKRFRSSEPPHYLRVIMEDNEQFDIIRSAPLTLGIVASTLSDQYLRKIKDTKLENKQYYYPDDERSAVIHELKLRLSPSIRQFPNLSSELMDQYSFYDNSKLLEKTYSPQLASDVKEVIFFILYSRLYNCLIRNWSGDSTF